MGDLESRIEGIDTNVELATELIEVVENPELKTYLNSAIRQLNDLKTEYQNQLKVRLEKEESRIKHQEDEILNSDNIRRVSEEERLEAMWSREIQSEFYLSPEVADRIIVEPEIIQFSVIQHLKDKYLPYK